MSADAARANGPADQPTPPTRPRPSRRDLLGWTAAAGGLLLGSGSLRILGAGTTRPEDLTAVCPFPLATIPRAFDGWSYVEGSETHLDQPTTRITGSTDHLIRSYQDEMTGTTLSALVLYGPAEPVLPHTPQVCYPASGYRSLAAPVDRTVELNNQRSAVFRAALFAKSGGRSIIRQSVYHSYRLDGVWSPMVTDRSLPRRRAGLFKVQIQRRVLDGERTQEADEPIESFLRQLLPTLEQMIAASGTTPPAPATEGRATPPAGAARP